MSTARILVAGCFLQLLTLNAGYAAGIQSQSLDLCHSPIYCQGELLRTVQLAGIFQDSKTFVDYSQKHDEDVTLANFNTMMAETNNKPPASLVQKFVQDNFQESAELENATLADWSPRPPILSKVKDPYFRQWVQDLNGVWKNLARRVSADVRDHPSRHSIIYVNGSFVIPGGRFKEFYYWDTYWIIEGLLLCGMTNTSRDVLENFLSMVRAYGFVPNGNRVYYLMRSQPPMLVPMMELYYRHTKDWSFVSRSLATLDKEFKFWQTYKTVDVEKNGKVYRMARYVVDSVGPRPESYREDFYLASNLITDERKKRFYDDVKAGAESGWDFSARWFIGKKGDPSLDLEDIETRNVIPVDLNAFLERNARIMAGFHKRNGNVAKARYYSAISQSYRDGIEAVLWNERDGMWYDYNIKDQRPRESFYLSNLAPLYTRSYDSELSAVYGKKALGYLSRYNITDYRGGCPASLDNSSQQWDYPNAWPPLQSILVQGLRLTNYSPAMQLAKRLALTWLRSNYLGYSETGKMYEKYDCRTAGLKGGGGEYNVQDGFGWTNGVALEFLDTYPWSTSDAKDLARSNNDKHRATTRTESAVLRKAPSRLVLKSIWDYYDGSSELRR